MKKIVILLLVLAMLLPTLSSCGFDKDSAKAELIGTWGTESLLDNNYEYLVFLPNNRYREADVFVSNSNSNIDLYHYMTGTYEIERDEILLRQDDGTTRSISFRWNNKSGKILLLGSYSKISLQTSDFNYGIWTPSWKNPTITPQDPSTPQEQKPQKTAYELLNSNEKKVFVALVVNFYYAFENPRSVKIGGVRSGISSLWYNHKSSTLPERRAGVESDGADVLIVVKDGSTNKFFSLKLENGIGAYNTTTNKKGALIPVEQSAFDAQNDLSYISVDKLNNALTEYCQEKGY